MAGREPPTLVGREAELAVLTSAWGDAESGVPVVVLVGGEAGIGKTALLNRFAAGLGDGVLVLRGQCVDLGGQGLAYAPLVGVLSDLVRQVGRESVIRLAGAWRADLARLVPDLGPAATDAEAGRSRLFQGVVSLLEQAASRHLVVLVVEDLHWADESTLELLRFAVRTLRDGRLMLAGSYRSDELTRRHPLTPVLADLVTTERVTQLLVPRLGADETAGLVRRRVGAPVDAALVDSLVARSEGVPFYAEELARSAAQGVKGLPGTLAEVLSARLGELTGDAWQVVEAAAVGGADISETDVAAVLDLPGERVDAALREGIDRQILTMTQGSADVGFRHALLREAVLDSLLPGRQGTLHRRWAQHLAATPAAQTDAGRAVRVAQHWHAAHDTDHAFTASLTAARLLRSAAAPDEELRMLEQALSLWDTVAEPQIVARSDRSTLLGEAGAAAVRAGEALRALDLLDAALTNISEVGQEVRAANLLLHKSLAHEQLGRATMEEPTRAVEALSAVADEPAAAEMMAMALGMLAFRSSAVGEFVEAESFALRTVETARQSGSKQAEAQGLSQLANALSGRGRYEEALEFYQSRMKLEEHVPDPALKVVARHNMAVTLAALGRLTDASGLAAEARQVATALGLGRSEGSACLVLEAEIKFDLGSWDEALALCRSAQDLRPPAAVVLASSLVAARIGILRGDRYSREDAWRLPSDRDLPDPAGSLAAASLEALAHLEAEEGVKALAVVERAPRPEAGTDPDDTLRSLHIAARAAAAGSRPGAESAERLSEHVSPHNEFPRTNRETAWMALVRAETAGLSSADPVEAWTQAVDALEAAGEGFAWEKTYALYSLGRELVAVGRDDEAARWLTQARAGAEHLRALPLLGRIVAASRRCGSGTPPTRERREQTAEPLNPFGLTSRELEVLMLVAEGRSNSSIAGRLFISPKTVSVHVTNILRKMSVPNRRQAAEKARELGLLTSDHDASSDDAVVGPVSEGP